MLPTGEVTERYAGRRRVQHGDVMHRQLAAATWTFAANSEVLPDGSVAVAVMN